MKTLEKISQETASRIKTMNSEYLQWEDGTDITEVEIRMHFRVVQVGTKIYLSHKREDFYIDDIVY